MGSFANERLSKGFESEEMLFRKEYTDREHLITAFGDMKDFRDADEFCDVIVKVENREIKAHRVILAASSIYLKHILNGRTQATLAKPVELPQQKYESVKYIIDYIYTGKIEMNLEIAEDIYKTADFLQMDRVKTVCSHFLKAALNRESCLLVWNIAGNIGLQDIQNDARKQSVATLDNLHTSGAFLNLCLKKMEELLQESSDQVRPDKVYRAIIAWVKHDLEKRKASLGQLLRFVSPQKITREFLRTTIIKEALLTENMTCLIWLHQIFVSLFDADGTELSQEEEKLMNLSSGNIYVSSLRGRYSTFYKFDTISSEVVDLPSRTRVRYSFPVFHNNSIYFTGGLVKTGCSTQCDRFNLADESWDVIPLECDRYYHGASVMEDNLYLVGGCKDHQNLKSVSIHDFETGSWTNARDMNVARKFFGIVKHNGCIYATAGVTDKPTAALTAERFDPREGTWQNIAPLHRIAGACSAAVASNAIYCSGFRSGIVEKFEPRMNEWANIPDALSLPGSLVSTKGELYRVSVDGIQRYDHHSNLWNNTLDVSSFSTEIVAVAN